MSRQDTRLVALALGIALSGAAFAADWQALPDTAPAPADNPTTPAKVELGKMLYHDARLSQNGTLSCASCHSVMGGGVDNRPTSIGVGNQHGGRNAPTVWNAAFHATQFWDGRAPSLEEQAKGPIANPIEMGMPDVQAAVDRVRAIPGYKPYFEKAFGTGDTVTVDNLAKAIAAYERTLITPNSPYDRFVKGDKAALSAQQQRGMEQFAAIGCTACHSGAAFNGPQPAPGKSVFQKFPLFADGNPYIAKYKLTDDQGRYDVTKNDADRHLWRVPTLRNIAWTAPYFHNGEVKTLSEAVRVMAKSQLNRELDDATVGDIVAFLDALSGPFPKQEMPQLPPAPTAMLQ